MIKFSTVFAALGLTLAFAAPVLAQEAHVEIEKQGWSFAGPFGNYDKNQLQRGFQVFKEVCSSCHAANLLAFRNLAEEGGPGFSEAQVKALAASYDIADPAVEGGTRKGTAADHWPAQMSAADARAAFGMVPPDMSVLAKARGTTQPFPWWILNYFTAYQEGGPDYIHALLGGYREEVPADAPKDFKLPDGKYYNVVFPGHAIGMPPPLADGQVAYGEAEGAAAVPQTAEQYSEDVSAFLMWVADPHMTARKASGFQVLLFLILFGVIMYLVKRRLWSKVEH